MGVINGSVSGGLLAPRCLIKKKKNYIVYDAEEMTLYELEQATEQEHPGII